MDKYTILDLITECHRVGYISLRNDLINDIKHQLNDEELNLILEMVQGGTVQSLQVGSKHRDLPI